MTAATHRLGGLAIGFAVSQSVHMNQIDTVIVIAGSLLGSVLPDIDNWHSSISHKWRFISSIVSVFQNFIRLLSRVLPRKSGDYVRSLIGHRGITHSLTAVLLPFGIFSIATFVGGAGNIWILVLGIVAGMLSHVILDMFSGGAPLFMPFSTKRIRLAGIKTGGALELCCRGALLLAVGWIFGREYITEIIKFF